MRAWWSGTLSHFRRSNPGTIVGALSTRTVETNVTNRDAQLVAWRRQIEVLSEATAGFPPDDRLLLEYPLLRLGRRIDAVLVTKTAILVLEFKVGAKVIAEGDRRQVEDYALDLQDFHSGKHWPSDRPHPDSHKRQGRIAAAAAFLAQRGPGL